MTNALGDPQPREAEAQKNRWRDLLDLDARMYRERNVRLLTAEGRVLLSLLLSGPSPVSSVMQIAGTSSRGFYDVLERLKQAGLIAKVRDSQDHRVRNISASFTMPPPTVVKG